MKKVLKILPFLVFAIVILTGRAISDSFWCGVVTLLLAQTAEQLVNYKLGE